MRVPGFTGEASLYQRTQEYRNFMAAPEDESRPIRPQLIASGCRLLGCGGYTGSDGEVHYMCYWSCD